MQTLFQDIRFGCRMLVRNPGFTIAALLCLGLGIGATTAVFSVVNAVLLKPLPYKDSNRLIQIYLSYPRELVPSGGYTQFQLRGCLPWKDKIQTMEKVALVKREWGILSNEEGGEQAKGLTISDGLFEILGINALVGRSFLKEEYSGNGASTIVLSYDFWKRHFNLDKNAIGKIVKLNNVPRTIIGVMPPETWSFASPQDQVDFWIPTQKDVPLLEQNSNMWDLLTRMKSGVDLAQAQAELDVHAEAVVKSDALPKGTKFVAMAMLSNIVGDRKPVLLLLLIATFFVLMIACANVSGLVMVRMISRQHELMIRLAMGSGRFRLIRQLFTEALLLALLGGVAGVLIAYWGTDILSASAQSFLPRVQEVKLDAGVLGFALAVTLLTGLTIAASASIRALRMNVSQTLREVGRSVTFGLSRQRLIRLIVISEIALSVVLLAGAGLAIQSLVRLMHEDTGIEPKGLLTMDVGRPAWDKQFGLQLLERVKVLPGVEKAAIASMLPFGGGSCSNIIIPGNSNPDPTGTVWFASISPDYFQAMGIPLMRGRALAESDTSGTMVVINQKMADHFWPGENPIGKRFKGPCMPVEHEIVGVVKNTKRLSLDKDSEPQAYTLYPDGLYKRIELVLKTGIDPYSLVAPVRREVRSLDRDAALSDIKTMSEMIAETIADKRFAGILLAIFAALGLALAIVGIYGVMANSVAQRTHDIGVRIAMGAQRRDIIRLVVGQGLVLIGIGVGIGLAGAFALTRLIASQLYGVKATDPWTFAGVTILLAAVALLACYIPARRATKIDPMEVLRWE